LNHPVVGTVAPIEIFFQVATAIASSGNGKIEVSLATSDQLGVASKGFTATVIACATTFICKIKKVSDSSDVPCSLVCGSSPQFVLTVYSQIAAVIKKKLNKILYFLNFL